MKKRLSLKDYEVFSSNAVPSESERLLSDCVFTGAAS